MERHYIRVPNDRVKEAWQWLLDRDVFAGEKEAIVAENLQFIHEHSLGWYGTHTPMSLDTLVISNEDRMLFKLTFAG